VIGEGGPKMPFTIDQFLDVFEKYNLAVWPMQIILVALGVGATFLVFKNTRSSDKIINGILGFFWIWIGIVYHLAFFTAINKAAYIFGALFIFQGLLFIYLGVVRSNLSYKFRPTFNGIAGLLFLIYAFILYPLLGHAFGHAFPRNPTFGLPCPTTIFTFGILLWALKPPPLAILVIPLVWSIIGFGAARSLGIREDTGLVVAGIVGTALIWIYNKSETRVMTTYKP
jgi:hypothetical protein